MSYTIGVNREVTNGHNFKYTRNSVFLDGVDTVMNQFNDGKMVIASITLYKNYQKNLHKNFDFLNDLDDFNLKT